MDKNQQVLAASFKKAKRKLKTIKELNVTKEWSEDQIVEATKVSATARAEREGGEATDFLDKQEWYIRMLVDTTKMVDDKGVLDVQAVLDKEYEDTFADVAEEDEMLEDLRSLAA